MAVAAAQAQTTLYWSGGTTNKLGRGALIPTNGNWSTLLTNWGDAASGTATYSAWDNPAGNTASFGARIGAQTVQITTNVRVGGLSTYVFEGSGVGSVTLRSVPTAMSLTLTNNTVINVATGTTLQFGGGNDITLASSNLTVTGGGTLNLTTYGGTYASGGTLTVSNATFTIGDGPYQSPFGNDTLVLSPPNARFAQGRWDDFASSPWAAITGTGIIQPSTTTCGIFPFFLNNTADTVLNAQVLDGTNVNVESMIYKLGAGKLTLMNSGNAYFGNFVRQGLLTPGAANTVKGWVLVDGSSTATGIFGTSDSNFFVGGAVTADSGGQINGANMALSQYQLMAGGAVQYNSLDEIPGTGRVLNGTQPGAVTVGGYAFDSNFLQRIQESFDGVIALGANIGSGTTLDFSSAAGGNFVKARLGAWGGARTFDGTLLPNGATYRLGGGNSILTLSAALTGSGSLDVSDGPNKGFFGQTSFAANGATLTANNTLSGPVTVGHGATLTLSGASGRLGAATGLTVTEGGTLALADSSGASQGDRIPDTVELALRRSGTLRFAGQGGATESAGRLTLDGGYATVSAARGSGSGNAMIRFSSANLSNWGAANFVFGTGGQIGFVTPPATNGALLGPWAVIAASTCFAAYQTNNGVVAPALSTVNSDAAWQLSGSNTNVYVNAAFTATAPKTVGSVGINASSAYTVAWAGTSTVVNGGILLNGSATVTFTNGQWTAGTPDRGLYLYDVAGYGNLTLYSDITDSNDVPVTVVACSTAASGVAVVLSSTNNTFSGGVVINGGTLRATTATALGTGSNLMFNGLGATLDLYGTDARTLNQSITVNADATILNSGSAGSTTLNGDITLNNNSLLTLGVYTLARPITNNGVIHGLGSLRLRSSSSTTITLQGSAGNTYTGDTFVAAVTVLNKSSGNAIPGSVYLGTIESANPGAQRPTLILGQSEQIADTAVVTFGGGVGGTRTGAGLSLPPSPVFRLNGKSETIAGLSSLAGNGIVENGTNTALSTLTLGGSGAYLFGGLIWNGASGAQALVKTGTGTQTLTGASTYTGGTTVNGGTLLVRNTTGSGTGSGNVTVGAGGTLGGDGRIDLGASGALVVNGALAPAVGGGTLTIDCGNAAAGMILNSGATLACRLGAPGTNDQFLFVNTGNGGLTPNGNVINFTDAGGLAPGSYTLMTFYADDGVTLTDVGKPTSGLIIGAGLGAYATNWIDYSQTGKIVLQVAQPQPPPPAPTPPPASSGGTNSTLFRWRNTNVQGMGYVTGLAAHPAAADLLYARTDIGGAYRWDGSQWLPLLDAFSIQQFGMGCETLAVDPADTNRVYLAGNWGYATNADGTYRYAGEVLISTNRGQTWMPSGLASDATPVYVGPNGNYRQSTGERLVCDPYQSGRLYFGTGHHGLWFKNGAAAWTRLTNGLPAPSALEGYCAWSGGAITTNVDNDFPGDTFVLCDPTSGATGTPAQTVYAGIWGRGVHVSANAGLTWTLLPGSPVYPRKGAIGSDGTLYIADGTTADINRTNGTAFASYGALFRYRGGVWTAITPSGTGSTYNALAVDRSNPSVVMTACGKSIWRSTNAGAAWSPAMAVTNPAGGVNGPAYYNDSNGEAANGVDALVIDPLHSTRVWWANGFGVMRTDNILAATPVWTYHMQGMEELDGNMVLCPPKAGGADYWSAVQDMIGFRHVDRNAVPAVKINPAHVPTPPNSAWANGTWTEFPVPFPHVAGATGMDFCSGQPDCGVFVGFHQWQYQPYGGYWPIDGVTTDNGATWTALPSLPSETLWGGGSTAYTNVHPNGGSVAMSSADPNRMVWVGGWGTWPHYTADGGRTWQLCKLKNPPAPPSPWDPHNDSDNHYDCLPKAWGPSITPWVSSPCLTADRKDAAGLTFYFHSGFDFWFSTDGGATWTKGTPPAAGMPNWIIAPQVAANPAAAGEVWIAFRRNVNSTLTNRLYRSTNAGTNWSVVATVASAELIAFGKGDTDAQPAIYILGRVGNASADTVFQSRDGGVTWLAVSDPLTLQFPGACHMAADLRVKSRVYIATTGRGVFVGEGAATNAAAAGTVINLR